MYKDNTKNKNININIYNDIYYSINNNCYYFLYFK